MNKIINHLDKYKKWYFLGILILTIITWLFIPLTFTYTRIDNVTVKLHFNFIYQINKAINSSFLLKYSLGEWLYTVIASLLINIVLIFFTVKKYYGLNGLYIINLMNLFFVLFLPFYNANYGVSLNAFVYHSADIGFYILVILFVLHITLLIIHFIKHKPKNPFKYKSKSQRIFELEKEVAELKKERS